MMRSSKHEGFIHPNFEYIYIYTYIYILGEGWHNGEVAYLPAVKHGKAITNL
jgi:hypothetical protein